MLHKCFLQLYLKLIWIFENTFWKISVCTRNKGKKIKTRKEKYSWNFLNGLCFPDSCLYNVRLTICLYLLSLDLFFKYLWRLSVFFGVIKECVAMVFLLYRRQVKYYCLFSYETVHCTGGFLLMFLKRMVVQLKIFSLKICRRIIDFFFY